MISAQNLAVLLRALRQGEASPRSLPLTKQVSRALPVLAVSQEDGSAPALRAQADAPLPHAAARGTGGDEAPDGGAFETTPHELGSARGDARPRAGVASSATLTSDTAPEPARASPPSAPTASARITLSSAGEALREVLSEPARDEPAIVRPRRSLLAGPPHDPAPLARELARAVVQSGLFYESHVAQWAADRYPVAALREEPQASLPVAGEARTVLTADAPRTPDASLGLVRQQLETFEARQFVVQAELWPGQPGRFVFEESRAGERDGGGDGELQLPEHAWRTRVELMLPSLGLVHATIAVDRAGVHCSVRAAGRHAATRLDEARADLEAALAAMGLALAQCEIGHGAAR